MLVHDIARLLTDRHWHLSVAESATGGLLSHWITAVSGSSAYFEGGIITYSDDVKHRLLGVREETLTLWGAVSARVAMEMAQGACQATGTEVALSITGIAGPTGATAFKPVGLYYIGLAAPNEAWAWRHYFDGDRAENNERCATAALQHLSAYLRGS